MEKIARKTHDGGGGRRDHGVLGPKEQMVEEYIIESGLEAKIAHRNVQAQFKMVEEDFAALGMRLNRIGSHLEGLENRVEHLATLVDA